MFIDELNALVSMRVSDDVRSCHNLSMGDKPTSEFANRLADVVKTTRLNYAETFGLLAKENITQCIWDMTEGTNRGIVYICDAIKKIGMEIVNFNYNLADFTLTTSRNNDRAFIDDVINVLMPVCAEAKHMYLGACSVMGVCENQKDVCDVLRTFSQTHTGVLFSIEFTTRTYEKTLVRFLNGKEYKMYPFAWDVDYPDIDMIEAEDDTFWDGYNGERF